jgi:tryptophanase
MDDVVEATIEVYQERDKWRGSRILSEPFALRHFTARFEEL